MKKLIIIAIFVILIIVLIIKLLKWPIIIASIAFLIYLGYTYLFKKKKK
jgi:threonine/homoserine/homoserine lactone efflux protein